LEELDVIINYWFLIDFLVGVPEFFWFGYDGEYTILITELLGPSL